MYQFQDDMLYADNINMFVLISFTFASHGALEKEHKFILLIH